MRTLITGARGFAGRHLASECARAGHEVLGVGRRGHVVADQPDEALAGYLQADLTDSRQARRVVSEYRPDAVFHLAADASVARSWEDPGGVLRNNLLSTVNLLEAVRTEQPDAKMLLAGSGEVYGAVPADALPVEERRPLSPQNPYAAAKAATETMAAFYGDVHGLMVVQTRAFNHAGPGQSTAYVVARFACQIAEAEAAGADQVEVVTGNIETRRDFTDVRDVVRAYRLLLDAAEPGVYNVCSGDSVAIAGILTGLAEHTSLRVSQSTDPALLRDHDVMDIRGSNQRLSEATAWTPEIPLARTLGDTLDWWRGRSGNRRTS